MSSIVVLGGNYAQRKTKIEEIIEKQLDLKLSENNPDLLIIKKEPEKKSIGIAQVKTISAFVAEKPMVNKKKAVVVEEAHFLTDQAQNALLKNLEEHPIFCHFLLSSKNESSLLDTVISRCMKVSIKNEQDQSESTYSIENLMDMTTGEKLSWAAEMSTKERDEVVNDLEKMALEVKKKLLSDLKKVEIYKLAKSIETLLKVKSDLENTNVTLKLALEYLAVKL